MKRQVKIILSLLIISLVFMSCGKIEPTPTIESFTANAASIEAGSSLTFTVKGSTKDASEYSDTVDYSGTVKITSSPAGISEEIAVSADDATNFTVTKAITFPNAGTYTMTASLNSGSKSAESDSVTVTVTAAAPAPAPTPKTLG